MSNIPNSITKTFQDQVNSLIKDGVVKNRQQIIDALSWGKTQMSQAMAGTKNVPFEVYQKFVDKYGFKLEPEVGESDAAYNSKDEIITLLKQNNKLLEDQVNSATGELRHIMVMNFAILKTMSGAIGELLAKAGKSDLDLTLQRLNKEIASFYKTGRKKGSLIDFDI